MLENNHVSKVKLAVVLYIFFIALTAVEGGVPLSEVEVTPDDKSADGWRDYTIRLRPSENHFFDKLVFDCVLRQEFEWTNADGKKYTKVHEPAAFTCRRKNVKFVTDLDLFISFKVPDNIERVQKIFGEKMFMGNVPVSIPDIKISAYKAKKRVWKIKVPAKGKYDPVKKKKIIDKEASLGKKAEKDKNLGRTTSEYDK